MAPFQAERPGAIGGYEAATATYVLDLRASFAAAGYDRAARSRSLDHVAWRGRFAIRSSTGRALELDELWNRIARRGLERFSFQLGNVSMNFSDSTDESLLAYYESIRRQVAADKRLGGRYRLAGSNVKQYADELKGEMIRRQLSFQPIDWS